MRSGTEWLLRAAGVLGCLLACCLAVAQTANFTATPTSGCSPLPVLFVNTSTGFSDDATYLWDFGNGNTSALQDSAGAQYKDEREYLVTLTVTDNGNTYTKSTTVTVYQKPVVDFSVNTTGGCSPLPVTFTSHSTPGDGTIAGYFWDFGDGTTEAGNEVINHTYVTAGKASPGLTVTNSFGCYNTKKIPDLVEVLPVVMPSFTASQTVLCKVNDPVTFTNTSTGEGTLSYLWDFGDGNTANTKSPRHQYAQKGTYDISLKVTNSDGCTADTTLPAYINVANFEADFEVPALLCESTNVTFTDVSSPPPPDLLGQMWILDGRRYNNDSLQFTAQMPAGSHTVQLINEWGTCKDTATKKITVLSKPDTKGFAVQLQNSCGAPATVQFTDTTRGASRWEWDVDNTEPGNFEPAIFTNPAGYTYTGNGTYYVWLRTTNTDGCTAEVTLPLTIQPASATINSSAGEYGCDSLSTVFSAISSQQLTEFAWNFGDGSVVSNEKSPRHVYRTAGDFTVVLTFKTADGCSGQATYVVHVTPRPVFDFTASGTLICGSTPVIFDVSGTNTDGYYYWSFGDAPGYYPGTSTMGHQYYYDSTYTVSLVISKQGCSDTVTKKDYIKVLPPFPRIYNKANTCEGTRGLVTFEDATQKAATWSWDFGDGSAPYAYTSPQPHVQHNYSQTGSYMVKLTTTNGNCTVMDSVLTFVLLKQAPVLSAELFELCGSDNLPANISNLETNPAAVYFSAFPDFSINGVQYRDSTPFAGTYTLPGEQWHNSFPIYFTDLDNTKKDLRAITSSYYFNCLDTTNYIPIKIKGPKAGFEIRRNSTCFKHPITLVDTSGAGSGTPIISWQWQFGDGNSADKINSQPFDYLYENPGAYNLLLTVTDKNGCTDTAQQNNVIINGPQAAFELSDYQVLPGTGIYFYNKSWVNDTSDVNNQFTWQFGDGEILKNTALDSVPFHTYDRVGVDTVVLIAKNNITKCADTAVQYLYIKNPALNFSYTTEFINPGSGCPPMLATFTSQTLNTTSVAWNFGDGTTAGNAPVVSHTYNKPGRYKVTLYGYFSDNTVDSLFQIITIQGPFATLKTSKQFACGAEPITLTAKASNATSFTWDFGDGTLTGATDTFAVHRYLTPGIYTPSLIVKDSNACSFPFFLDKPIIIDTLHLKIGTEPSVVCDSSLVLFTPEIVSVAKDVAKVPLQYHWDFGTGSPKDTSNLESPGFTFFIPATYPVTFTASSPYGCVAATTANVVVKPTPAAKIFGPVSACQADSVVFLGNADTLDANITWKWRFPNGIVISEQNPPAQWFGTTTTDSVRLIVNNRGCADTAYAPFTVFAKPVVNLQPAQPAICAGAAIQLTAHDGVSYRWTPAGGIDNTTIANPIVSPDSSQWYKVTVTSAEGCVSTDSVLVRVIQPFTVSTNPLLYVCRGSSVQLEASGAELYQWIEGTNISNPAIANPVATPVDAQTYTVVGYDSLHCFSDTASTEIQLAELPTVTAGADITVLAGTPVTLQATASPDVVQWNWLPASSLSCAQCPAPEAVVQANTTYVVQVSTQYGCTATDSLQVNVLCKESLIQIPSAFTPNGDGRNERFAVRGNGIKLISQFAVFDRRGEVLFQQQNKTADDTNAGWDGTLNNKPMPPGAYVYLAKIVCATGEVYHYKGTVVLIR